MEPKRVGKAFVILMIIIFVGFLMVQFVSSSLLFAQQPAPTAMHNPVVKLWEDKDYLK